MTGNQIITLWNSAGLRASALSTPAKFNFFDSQFPNAKFSIAAFVETHHKDAFDYVQDFGQYHQTHEILHSPVHNETHSGVILLISHDYDIISKNDAIPGRLYNVKLVKNGRSLNLSVFYGPQWGKMNKEEISAVIEKFSPLHDHPENNIILGDFNFVDFDIDKGKKMSSKDQIIKPLWDNFLSEKNILDPFRVQCPRKKLFSFLSPQGKSRGDRVYVSEHNIATIKNIRYINSPFPTSHKILTFNLQSEPEIGPSSFKMNSSVLNDQMYIEEIEEVYADLEEMSIENPVDWWDLFITVVVGVTISYTKRKARIKRDLKAFLLKQINFLDEQENLNHHQTLEYNYYKNRLDDILQDEIRGHEIRTKGLPKYELNEPDISTYSSFEKRYQSNGVTHQLEDENGQIQSDTSSLLKITEKYYTKLFAKSRTNSAKQTQILSNVKSKLSATDRKALDDPLTPKQIEKALLSLANGKSPGPDGITVEFYKAFWYLIKDKFLSYINQAKLTGFREYRNQSSTTIVYKRKGEVYKLDYYRPIALINVDLKILTKTLSNRLRSVLPSIIHHSQTAVDKRRIDHTVHMIRDLIDLINKDNSEGALIFLDQEKAFDRVEHDFLFRTMSAFGIGDNFIDWLRVLYANATTRIKINGFFTNSIPLTRGVRQGCPLSPSLYVLVIEVFALQLRMNPNIVGFRINGERIVSMHYADDATIVIMQNRCFKEVIKEIGDYELASGAKVNMEKTKGLWLGLWKERTDSPLGLTWTKDNVKDLGVYFGNTNPGDKTFSDIMPKVKKSMNFWKQFNLSKFSKAKVTEIFHASRLWYASSFYPVPERYKKDLQKCFKDYANFPRSPTVSESEMKKLRLDGGIKLIDIQTKLEASRCLWLFDLIENPNLATHLSVVDSLIGPQKGGLDITDIVFTNKYYCNKLLRIPYSSFYTEGLKATAKLNLHKQILDLNNQKIFYNPMFRDNNLKTLSIPRRCERENIYTYGAVVEEYTKQCLLLPHKNYVANIFPKISFCDIHGKGQNTIFLARIQARIGLRFATHKELYNELLSQGYSEHHSLEKWEQKLSIEIEWEHVWASLNNPITSDKVKSTIWEQIHLNYYCTYSYNKWHNNQDPCPFCSHVPDSRFHLLFDCQLVRNLWRDLEPHLKKLASTPVTTYEMAFGLKGVTPCVILRNWLTYLLRHCIMEQESIAFHNQSKMANELEIKMKFNQMVKSEVYKKYLIYQNLDREYYFHKIFATKGFLVVWQNNWWQILTLYDV